MTRPAIYMITDSFLEKNYGATALQHTWKHHFLYI